MKTNATIKELTEALNNVTYALDNWSVIYKLNKKNWKNGTESDYYYHHVVQQEDLIEQLKNLS